MVVEWQTKRRSKLRNPGESAIRWLGLVNIKEVASVAQAEMLAVMPLLAELMEARLMWHFRARCRAQRMRPGAGPLLDVIAADMGAANRGARSTNALARRTNQRLADRSTRQPSPIAQPRATSATASSFVIPALRPLLHHSSQAGSLSSTIRHRTSLAVSSLGIPIYRTQNTSTLACRPVDIIGLDQARAMLGFRIAIS